MATEGSGQKSLAVISAKRRRSCLSVFFVDINTIGKAQVVIDGVSTTKAVGNR